MYRYLGPIIVVAIAGYLGQGRVAALDALKVQTIKVVPGGWPVNAPVYAPPVYPPVASVPPVTKTIPRSTNVPHYHTIPPAEYDHHYNGDLTINVTDSAAAMEAWCTGHSGQTTMACTRMAGTRCIVLMRNDAFIKAFGWTSGLILRHELAHCNGWPADHPGLQALK